MELLKHLCDLPGIPGREERVRAFIEARLESVVDELRTDALGNLIALKKGSGPDPKRVMIVAHMDEIGFYVKHIDDKGFVRVHNVGGFDVRQLLSKQVTLSPSTGEDLSGVLTANVKPPHTVKKTDGPSIPSVGELFVDLGMSAEDVQQRVRIGDMVTLKPSFQDLGDAVSSKAVDDRVGCWALIRTLERLQTPEHDVYGVFSVQEEVGLRGATASAYSLEPDIGVALDVTLAMDIPGAEPANYITELGEGVGIKILDSSAISTRWLVDEFIGVAEREEIRYQLEVLTGGGTDAASVQRSRAGVPSITLSVPCRYIHTTSEMIAKADAEATVDLLVAYLSPAS